jgi:hypothetical protein
MLNPRVWLIGFMVGIIPLMLVELCCGLNLVDLQLGNVLMIADY